MTTMTIRAAGEQDIPAIAAIYAACVLNDVATYELVPPSEDEMCRRWEAITRRGCPYLVAVESDGTVQGYAYASAFRERPAYSWLVEDSIYLAESARGLGLGRRLLDALLAKCEELGFRQMVAVIGGAHPASLGVHRSAGFEMIGRMPGTGYKFDRWLDTVIMQKALGDGASEPADRNRYPGTLAYAGPKA
ncbi:GNAT family N-acetyltransferase [Pararhizobium haloflavum]|uniref:GNAT family N-acetyltransferase n=1 Tax=Pararhizobium haloflavum TaxID=2037914 RepID=UPI001FE1A017|nr:GNAT family N-acetyltransferase [Pararhizobium haloflavum]